MAYDVTLWSWDDQVALRHAHTIYFDVAVAIGKRFIDETPLPACVNDEPIVEITDPADDAYNPTIITRRHYWS